MARAWTAPSLRVRMLLGHVNDPAGIPDCGCSDECYRDGPAVRNSLARAAGPQALRWGYRPDLSGCDSPGVRGGIFDDMVISFQT